VFLNGMTIGFYGAFLLTFPLCEAILAQYNG